jgi:hypothetical protein
VPEEPILSSSATGHNPFQGYSSFWILISPFLPCGPNFLLPVGTHP